MKRLLLAGLAGATAAATVTPAEAHSNWHYRGGCVFAAISDGTDSPQTEWDGAIGVRAVATNAITGAPAPTASITVDCELRINDGTPGTVVASCSTPGTGFVACADQFSFDADPDDVVTICDLVTVNGEFHKACFVPHPILIVPEPVHEILDEHVWPVFDEVAERVVCPVTRELDGGPADNPPAFDVRADGDLDVDVQVGADSDGNLILDCDSDDLDVDGGTGPVL